MEQYIRDLIKLLVVDYCNKILNFGGFGYKITDIKVQIEADSESSGGYTHYLYWRLL